VSTRIEKQIVVNVPVSVAYNQWTQFEEFPHFMSGVKKVEQLTDDRLHWVAEIGGVKREWEARILAQEPDRRVAWAATEGATNAGAVSFEDIGGGQTSIRLELEYEPEGMIEKIGDKLKVVEKEAEGDLKRFKEFIEDEGYATGAWRGAVAGGTVGSPTIEDAAASRGDSGKAGISGTAAAVGLGVAAAAAAGVAAATGGKKETSSSEAITTDVPVTPVVPVEDTTPPDVTPTIGTPAGVSTGAPNERPLGEPFDQTNGLADLDGESDGLAGSDTHSAAERGDDRTDGYLPPGTRPTGL
jgi:carbon monoxide dehydrogenase subunit G